MNIISKKYLCKWLIIILFQSCFLFGQVQSKFEKLGKVEGFSNGSITSIATEKDGFLWVGTKIGLHRYDGSTVKVYNRLNSALLDNDISDVYIDHDNFLWVATVSGGLYNYNSNTDDFDVYKYIPNNKNTLPTNYINTIFEDSNKNLWIGTQKGLSLYLKDSKSFENFTLTKFNSIQENQNSVSSIFEDTSGSLWIGTFGSGLYKFYVDSHKVISYPSDIALSNFVNDIESLDRQRLLIGTSGAGALIFDTSQGIFSSFFKNMGISNEDVKIVRCIHKDNNNTVWVGTDGKGLFQYLQKDDNKFQLVQHVHKDQLEYSISGNGIYDITNDTNNNLWIGTAWNGLNFLSGNNAVKYLYTDNNNEYSLPVLSIHKDDDLLLLGLDGGGLTIKKPFIKISNKDNEIILDNTFVQTIVKQNKDNYWLGTFTKGLYKINVSSKAIKHFVHDKTDTTTLAHNNVRAIVKDSNRGLWIGSWGGGLDYLNLETNKIEKSRVGDITKLSSNNIVSMIKTGESLWIATFGGGVNIYNTKNSTYDYINYDKFDDFSLSTNNTLSLFEDSKDNIWIGTSGDGVNRFDKKSNTITKFETDLNIKSQSVNAIIEDDSGVIWLSTKEGVFSYNYETNKFHFHELLKGDYHINSVFKDSEGVLYFGRVRGVVKFDPSKIELKDDLPAIKITGFKLFNEDVPIDQNGILTKNIVDTKQIILPYNKDVLTFEFAALKFPNSKNCEFEIKMENFDKNWRSISNNTSATYTSLPAGDYIFKVKNKNSKDKYSSIKLKVLYPLWLRWWAIIFYIITIILIFYLFKKYISSWEGMKLDLKLEKLKRQKDIEVHQLKQQFFTNISHEIRTPVTLLLGAINRFLESENKKENSSIIDYAAIIDKNGKFLYNLANELIDFGKYDYSNIKLKITNNDIAEFCEEIYMSFKSLASDKDIDFQFNSTISNTELWFDKNQIEKVIYNLLSNAFKYTNYGGKVSVKIIDVDNSVNITISDSGIGIRKTQLNNIFNRFYQENIDKNRLDNDNGFGLGLTISKQIIDQHLGKIVVKSKKGRGSTFSIELQKGNKHFDPIQIVDTSALEYSNTSDHKITTESLLESEIVKSTTHSEINDTTLLILEDNLKIRDYLIELLSDECNILWAPDGQKGFEIALNEIPDLIISDIMMPNVDGVSFTKTLKEHINTSHIPVILLTARATSTDKLLGYNIGADDYITKPFNENILKSRIKNLLLNREIIKRKFEVNQIVIPEDISANQTDQKFLEKTIHIIHENISSSSLTAGFLSKELGMSHSVVYKKIKAISGMSCVEFIKDYKMKTAMKLISENHLKVSEACYQVGYSDKKYFSKIFKERFGKSPSSYLVSKK